MILAVLLPIFCYNTAKNSTHTSYKYFCGYSHNSIQNKEHFPLQ